MRDGPCLWVKEASKNGVQTRTSTVSLRARLLVDLGPRCLEGSTALGQGVGRG